MHFGKVFAQRALHGESDPILAALGEVALVRQGVVVVHAMANHVGVVHKGLGAVWANIRAVFHLRVSMAVPLEVRCAAKSGQTDGACMWPHVGVDVCVAHHGLPGGEGAQAAGPQATIHLDAALSVHDNCPQLLTCGLGDLHLLILITLRSSSSSSSSSRGGVGVAGSDFSYTTGHGGWRAFGGGSTAAAAAGSASGDNFGSDWGSGD